MIGSTIVEMFLLCVVLLCFSAPFRVNGDDFTKIALKMNEYYDNTNTTDDVNVVCAVCNEFFGIIISMIRKAISDTTINNMIYAACGQGELCDGLVYLNMHIFYHMIRESPSTTSKKICAIRQQESECYKDKRKKWSLLLPRYQEHSFQSDAAPAKILHFTNPQYDSTYHLGANAKCNLPTCCSADLGMTDDPHDSAGFWGSERCGLPLHTIRNLLEQFKKLTKIDYVYFSGNVLSRRTWDASPDRCLDTLSLVYDKIKKKFRKTPVYPVLGVYDAFPAFVFAPGFSEWYFSAIAKMWGEFLPEEALETVAKGGYYTTLIRPGLRMIGLNNAVCHIYNWQNIRRQKDPYDQLSWLIDVLFAAEKNSEQVHILMSLTPGNPNCVESWSLMYHDIVERFHDTITGQFSGDQSENTFRLFYETNNIKKPPINIAYNVGHFSPHESKNPSFLVYLLDGQTNKVVDMELWYFVLNLANIHQPEPPAWLNPYSFAKFFDIPDMDLKLLEKLIIKTLKHPYAAKEMQKYATAFMYEQCGTECLMKICHMVTTRVFDYRKCEEILSQVSNT